MKSRIFAALCVVALIIFPSLATAADLTLACSGVLRKDGTASERNIYYEIEFFFATGAYRWFTRPGGVRTMSDEGSFTADNNEIVWAGYRIDRSSGDLIRKYKSQGASWTEYMNCAKIDGTGNRF
ncbi:hypothetical protein [Sinorhizobium meliloti]|uniref:hypothetical protein n=1 Tax=Rhizobium meliloti TaxID=382 RepID=UPI000FE02E88|nr:hypothetical protein [Sinorhizobium meliloti]RVM00637.1 hypothetical protein CN136_04105 [Sinorhizobium meliloti]